MLVLVKGIIKFGLSVLLGTVNKKVVQIGLSIASEITKRTNNPLDNAAIACIASIIRDKTKELGRQDKSLVAQVIEAVIEESVVNLYDTEVEVNLAGSKVTYDHKNGKFTWLNPKDKESMVCTDSLIKRNQGSKK